MTLRGSGFAPEITVTFSRPGGSASVPGQVLSDDEAAARVPDAFEGAAATLSVVAVDGEGQASDAVELVLEAEPDVESVTRLCSLGTLRAVLGVAPGETLDDAKLNALIAKASVQIVAYCRSSFGVLVVADELRDGDDSPLLTLAHTPILSVSALSIDGQAVGVTEVKVYPNWIRFEDGGEYNARLRGSGRIFPRGCQNVRVSYRAGYARVPADIMQACIDQVIYLQNTLPKQGLVSETNAVANATTQYSHTALCPAARIACNRYRRPRVTVV